MKILRRGIPPEDKLYKVVCCNCKSLIEFEQKEGKITYDQRDGNYITITCPVCGNGIHKDLE